MTTVPSLPLVMAIPEGEDSASLADAQLIISGERKILAIRRSQSLQSAVAAAVAVLRHDYPHLHPDQVRELLRPVLPDTMVELDAPLGSRQWVPLVAPVDPGRPGRASTLGSRLRASLGAAGLVALGVMGGWALAQSHPVVPSARDASPYTSNAQFQTFAAAGRMRCQPLTALRARCTDTDGLVMYSEAAISPDSVAYTFSYGEDAIFLRAFRSAADATAWGHEQDTIAAYPNLAVHDRFALWGSDPERIGIYLRLLKSAPEASSQGSVMPDRLAEIALGTLLAAHEAGDGAVDPAVLPSGTLVAVGLVMGTSRSLPDSPLEVSTDERLLQSLLLVRPSPAAGVPRPLVSGTAGPTGAPEPSSSAAAVSVPSSRPGSPTPTRRPVAVSATPVPSLSSAPVSPGPVTAPPNTGMGVTEPSSPAAGDQGEGPNEGRPQPSPGAP